MWMHYVVLVGCGWIQTQHSFLATPLAPCSSSEWCVVHCYTLSTRWYWTLCTRCTGMPHLGLCGLSYLSTQRKFSTPQGHIHALLVLALLTLLALSLLFEMQHCATTVLCWFISRQYCRTPSLLPVPFVGDL
jgi:hypothetical protein